jgi:predicted flap endonuclease-1-like 5' DNA nuclease
MTFILPEVDGLTKSVTALEMPWAFDPVRALEAASKLQISFFEATLAFWLTPFAPMQTKPQERATVATSLASAELVNTHADAPKLLIKPEGRADDLQRIVGIGPKLSKLLNDIGVWHFRQIASWTPTEVSWVNDKIAFKGRIEREGWQKQAPRLARSVAAA